MVSNMLDKHSTNWAISPASRNKANKGNENKGKIEIY
jgi:hypothetical protein